MGASETFYTSRIDDKASALRIARAVMAQDNVVFLDTETTGLRGDDQVCQVALVSKSGRVVLDTLVKPTIPIPEHTSVIHGITDDMVQAAPSMGALWSELRGLLLSSTVVIYNADFDLRLLAQSLRAHGIEMIGGDGVTLDSTCAMRLFAQYNGEWDDYHGHYRWRKLGEAGRLVGAKLPEGMQPHTALADAEMCRQIMLKLAEGAEV
jgi:DNA polymerase III epsilon subunit-like protein